MSRWNWRNFRRNYSRSLSANLADLFWFAAVVVIPGLLLVAVPFAMVRLLDVFAIAHESGTAAAVATSLTGIGSLFISGTLNHERWRQLVKQGHPSLMRGLCWLGSSLVLICIWILVGLAVFTLGLSVTASYAADEQYKPLLTSTGVSWLAGLFAVSLVAAFTQGAPGKLFRGRPILSGKKQAQKRASKNRWRI